MDFDQLSSDFGIETIKRNPAIQSLLFSSLNTYFGPDEKLLWIGHRSLRSFFLHYIFMILLLFTSLFLFAFQIWFLGFFTWFIILVILGIIIADCRFATYAITNKHIICEYPGLELSTIFNRNSQTILINEISSVHVKKNPFFQFLNIGTLLIGNNKSTFYLQKDPELAFILGMIAPWAGLFYAKRYVLSLCFMLLWIVSLVFCVLSLFFILMYEFNISVFLTFFSIFLVYVVLVIVGAFTAFTSAIQYNLRKMGGMFALSGIEKIQRNLISMIGRL